MEDFYEKCECCYKIVDTREEKEDEAMLIADCNTCAVLLFRKCLTTENIDRCILCINSNEYDD